MSALRGDPGDRMAATFGDSERGIAVEDAGDRKMARPTFRAAAANHSLTLLAVGSDDTERPVVGQRRWR